MYQCFKKQAAHYFCGQLCSFRKLTMSSTKRILTKPIHQGRLKKAITNQYNPFCFALQITLIMIIVEMSYTNVYLLLLCKLGSSYLSLLQRSSLKHWNASKMCLSFALGVHWKAHSPLWPKFWSLSSPSALKMCYEGCTSLLWTSHKQTNSPVHA